MLRKILTRRESFISVGAIHELPLQTVFNLLLWAKEELRFLGLEEAQTDAEQLLGEVLGLDRASLYLQSGQMVTQAQEKKIRKWVAQRKQRVPLAYLLKKAPFWNEVLEVSEACLIPRPETEILVERFLEKSGFQKNDPFSFLDLGSGSGAIGIALLRHYPNAHATFSDFSKRALKITEKNLKNFELLDRSEIIQSDLFKAFGNSRWDAIVSNPPYLSHSDFEHCQPEILFEPRQALAGGRDGLDFYRRIIREAPEFLRAGGQLWLEMGIGQAEKVTTLLKWPPHPNPLPKGERGTSLSDSPRPRRGRGQGEGKVFTDVKIFKDLNGIDRVVTARLKS